MIKSHLKIGNGPILNMADSHGLVYISSDSILSAPIKAFEETSYPEQDGTNINPKTVEDAFDYTVKFYVRADGSLGNANKIITDFNKKLTTQYGTIDLGGLTYKRGATVGGTIHENSSLLQNGEIMVGTSGVVGEFLASQFQDGLFLLKSNGDIDSESEILISCLDENGVNIGELDADISGANSNWGAGSPIQEILQVPENTVKILVVLDNGGDIRSIPSCFEANFNLAELTKDDTTVPLLSVPGLESMSYNNFISNQETKTKDAIAYKGDMLLIYMSDYEYYSESEFKDAIEGTMMTYTVRWSVGGSRTYNQVTFYNDYKRVKIVGYPNQISEATDFWRDSKNNTHDIVLVEWKIRVNKPSLCNFSLTDSEISSLEQQEND